MARKPLFVLVGLVGLGAGGIWLFAKEAPVPPKSKPRTAPSPSVASVLPELSNFVERVRGRQFRDDVKIRALSEPLIKEELKKVAYYPKEVARAEAVLTLLGLLPPETDLDALLRHSDQRTFGFYDPARKELVTGKGC